MLMSSFLDPLGMLDPAPHSAPLVEAASALFDRLGPLHCLRLGDRELLVRSAVGLRFIRAMGSYSALEHELFGIALSELADTDAFVVEAAACLAADHPPVGSHGPWSVLGTRDRRRVLWIAAMLRLADALVGERLAPVGDAHVAWTDSILYVEIDGVGACDDALQRGRGRLAALEAVTGRRIVLTSIPQRRGVA